MTSQAPTTRYERVTDTRTRLPNRDSFYQDMESVFAEANVNGESIILLDIDIRGTDFVLRMFGPKERDSLVRQVGQRIEKADRAEAHVYHITQYRFAMVLRDRTYRQATGQAEAVVAALRQPFEVAGIRYKLDANVGISHCPNHADSLPELVRTAVFACYQAQGVGKDYATFDRSWDDEERRRFGLMMDLEAALERRGEIQLAYQPQVDLQTNRCVGVEGLCRWTHPKHGPIPPGHFLPFVEQTPLMMPLTEATLSHGLEDLAAWRKRGFEGSVGINLSPTLFRAPDFLDRLREQSRFAGVGLENVDFEITETGIVEYPNRAIHMLQELRNQGSSVAVDDFGTGHSSLAYLADLPIDIIKIDKHFVQNLSKPWGEAIVGAAAKLAQTLDLKTVAEGIEQEEEYRMCRELGVTYGQGFYIGRPMPRPEVEEWLGI